MSEQTGRRALSRSGERRGSPARDQTGNQTGQQTGQQTGGRTGARAARSLPGPARTAGGAAPELQALSHPWLLGLFVLTATQPYLIQAGPLLIGPYRLVLLLAAAPLLLGWVQGRYGRFVLPDFLILAHTLWIPVCLAANGQTGRIVEYGGTQFVDIFVAYLLGRAAIRNRADFFVFVKVLLAVLVILLPFALMESLTGRTLLIDTFGKIPNLQTFYPYTAEYPARLGLHRAQTSMPHPILLGLFASIGVGLAWLVLPHAGAGAVWRVLMTGVAGLCAFLSVSAGALLSMIIQGGLIAWNAVLRALSWRWYLLGGLGTLGYIAVEIVSERPAPLALARLVAFSGSTAWNRYLIWQYGSAEVGRNPIFGMGLFTDWQRARWMTESVDNHWLVMAMRYGIPGVALLLGAYLLITVQIARRDFSRDPALAAIRNALVFIYVAFFIALSTVLAWQVLYALLVMMLGGSVWLYTAPDAAPSSAPGPGSPQRAPRGPARAPSAARTDPDEGAPDTDAAPDPKIDPGTPDAEAPDPGAPARRRPVYTRFPDPPGRRR